MRFRRRLRGPRRARRPGMKGDWIVLAHTACPFDANIAISCDSSSPNDALNTIALVDSNDIHDKQDHLTIVRMVGELNPTLILRYEIAAPGPNPLQGVLRCDEGIYVAGADDNSTGGELNPYVETDWSQDKWLWLRTQLFFPTIPTATDGFQTFVAVAGFGASLPASQPGFDVRVKRKLEFGDNLNYSWTWTATPNLLGSFATGTSLVQNSIMNASLRGYVKF